jgi:alginate O-acetyltransferase complex protein AlgI
LTLARAREAAWLLIYGYFLKTFVANGTAIMADAAFVVDQKSGWMTVLGTVAFAIQIYADFWAYSMIARGAGLALGIEFIWNFDQPYSATSMREFWRRWHISLSTWLRDYLYIPLGGSRGGRLATQRNLILTMVLGGLWHGAAWNFVLWGLLHGVALAIERVVGDALGPRRVPRPLAWLATMTVVLSGWLLFRCRSWKMIEGMVRAFKHMEWVPAHAHVLRTLVALTAPLVAIELWQLRRRDLLAPLRLHPIAFGFVGGAMVALTVVMWDRLHNAFIYFQF